MYVFTVIAVVLTIIAVTRIRVHIEYSDSGFLCVVRFLFFKMRFPMKKEKKCKQKKKEKAKSNEIKEKKSGGSMVQFRSLIKPVLNAAGKLARGIVIHELVADLSLSGSNAFETAVMYGAASAGVGIADPWVNEKLNIKKKRITLSPDFESSETKIYLCSYMSLAVWRIFAISASFVYQYIKSLNTEQRKES